MFDQKMRGILRSNANAGVSWYLMASYAYYELDDPILSDKAFDELAKFLLNRWDTIKHRHKSLITVDDLKAGSLLRRDFPEVVKDATVSLMMNLN